MADNSSATARPQPTEEQIEIRQQAKRMAKEQGLDWKAMSPDERKQIKRTVRQSMRSGRAS